MRGTRGERTRLRGHFEKPRLVEILVAHEIATADYESVGIDFDKLPLTHRHTSLAVHRLPRDAVHRLHLPSAKPARSMGIFARPVETHIAE